MAIVFLGLLTGIFSGIVGIGGGLILVPALTLIFGLSQHASQGTTLAMMVPPVGILAAWTYYQHGHVNIKVALLLILGFVFGGLIGAKIAVQLPVLLLRKLFAALLIVSGIYMMVK